MALWCVSDNLRKGARALSIAIELGHPVYDCVYLALAEALSTTLVTADQRLARACGGTDYEGLVELARI